MISCSTGKNIAQDVFTSENLNKTIQHTYPFDIIFDAMGDESTYFYTAVCKNGSYGKFITALSEGAGTPDYYASLKKADLLDSKNPVPQIRYKNTEYFLPVYTPSSKIQDTLIISNVMVATRTEPLEIKPDIKYIVLYSPVVPFAINVPERFNGTWYYKFKPSAGLISSFFENKVVHFYSVEINSMGQFTYREVWKQRATGELGIFCDLLAVRNWVSAPDSNITEQQIKEIFPNSRNLAIDPTFEIYALGKVIVYDVTFTKEAITGIIKAPNNREYIVQCDNVGSIKKLIPVDVVKKKQDYIVAFEEKFGKIPEINQAALQQLAQVLGAKQ